MDIVSRIKEFMNLSQISSSQFADTCNIPRPTISQILNGRNKKISDEIIGKIHSSFPSLSMLWLMFGEGDMLLNKNIEISAAKNMSNFDNMYSQPIDNGLFGPSLDFNLDSTENTSENLAIDFIDKKGFKYLIRCDRTFVKGMLPKLTGNDCTITHKFVRSKIEVKLRLATYKTGELKCYTGYLQSMTFFFPCQI